MISRSGLTHILQRCSHATGVPSRVFCNTGHVRAERRRRAKPALETVEKLVTGSGRNLVFQDQGVTRDDREHYPYGLVGAGVAGPGVLGYWRSRCDL